MFGTTTTLTFNSVLGLVTVSIIDSTPYFHSQGVSMALGHDSKTMSQKDLLAKNKICQNYKIPLAEVYLLIGILPSGRAEDFKSWLHEDILPRIHHVTGVCCQERCEEIKKVKQQAQKESGGTPKGSLREVIKLKNENEELRKHITNNHALIERHRKEVKHLELTLLLLVCLLGVFGHFLFS